MSDQNNLENEIDAGLEIDEEIKIIVSKVDKENFSRLDHLLIEKLPQFSRNFIKNLFERDQIIPGEKNPDLKLELKKVPPIDCEIIVQVPPPLPSTALPENIPLEILFEDEHLVIVNKPAGMVTHPAPGNYTGTLVNAILYHCKDIQGVGDQKRPGIVHRLDKGTSGVMVIAKNQKCHEGLVLLFSTHDIERKYLALVTGKLNLAAGKIETTIGRDPHNRLKMKANVSRGKKAITFYQVLNDFTSHSLVEFKLETGRTHQIRVHAAEVLKHSLLMDSTYGSPTDHLKRLNAPMVDLIKDYPYPFLHAKVLGLIHPITKEQLRFEVPPPKIFQSVLELSN